MRNTSMPSWVASGILKIPLAARLFVYPAMLVTLVCCVSPGALVAQTDQFSEDSVALVLESLDDTLGIEQSATDSLKLMELEIEIDQARLHVTETDFLHRLIPQIHFSASFGIKDIIFIDPPNSVPYFLPRDAYRLSLTLSFSELLDASKHQAAELRVKQLQTAYDRTRQQQTQSRMKLEGELNQLYRLISFTSEELKLKEEVLKFNDLRFQQGKIEFDVLIRTKLDVLNVKKSIYHLNQHINVLRSTGRDGAQP